ncbi:MAG TPA: DUF4041 domain-containing protein [Pedobacter sp.]|nr:DUF4041 domain-containing protein [Pedobacter sp.]
MQIQLITSMFFVGFILVSGIAIFLWYRQKHFKSQSNLEQEKNTNLEALIIEKTKIIDELNLKYEGAIDIDKYVDDTKKKLYEERTAKREQVNQYVNESRSAVDREVQEKLEKANQYYDSKVKESDEVTKLHQELNQKYISALQLYKTLEKELSIYQDDLEVKEFGLYKPVYDFDTSEEYKSKLEYNYLCQKKAVQSDVAAYCAKTWTVDGSVVEGRKMVKLQKKLMLFAFNGECDAMIAKMKWNTATRTIERVEKAYDTINKLGRANEIQITYEYLLLKKEELALSHEYMNKIHEEKEEQRMIREQMREEEKAKREYEIAQREAAEDERRYQNALLRIKDELQFADKGEVDTLNSQIRQLEEKLKEATEKKERAISMAQLTKVGHIYIISNIGSFGEDIYKIGMTRRLDPNDRVRELGGASVPFQFDVHAIIYSDNAPQMEYELHKHFKDKRINRVNGRKEFFKVSLEEIEEFVNQDPGASIKVTKSAEAKEYRETLALINSLLVQTEIMEIESQSKFPESLM